MSAGVELLERAMAYTLGCLQLVTTEAMARPSPCSEWDLRALLLHMNDSLVTLHEAITRGQVELDAAGQDGDHTEDYGDPEVDPVAALRARGCQMIGSWASTRRLGEIAVADRQLPSPLVAATGAVEVAVHGWDVARACGHERPVPPSLALELLGLCHFLIREGDRPARFARPVRLAASAGPGDLLLAFTGRDPR
jgi:uncharacterized protein (TIGR03086 family)